MNPIFDSLDSIAHAINYFLDSKQLTLGAVFTAMVPFLMIWSKVNREREKKKRSMHIERTQQRMERNQKKIMDHFEILGEWGDVEWDAGRPNLNRITVTKSLNGLRTITSHVHITELFTRRMAIKKLYWRKLKMKSKLLSRKLWMAIFGALLPVINQEFNLGLDTNTVIASAGAIVAYILGQAHVDAKAAQAAQGGNLVADTKPTIDLSANK